MIEYSDIAAKSQTLRQQFEAKLGVKSKTLQQAFRRAGRLLPRRVRQQGSVLVDAERYGQSPKIARQMDDQKLQSAYAEVFGHLRSIDAKDRRKGQVLSLAGVIAFNLLCIIVAFLFWLWWRGFI